jgi:hypothetical protein
VLMMALLAYYGDALELNLREREGNGGAIF